jgi:hypothetical protein
MSVYPVLKMLIELRKLMKEDLSRIFVFFISEIVFFFFGSGNWATLINRKWFQNCLTLPPYKFNGNDLPVTQPLTQTAPLPVAIPLTQIDTAIASGSNTQPAVVGAPSVYLDVPIPSSEMDITTMPLPLYAKDVPPIQAPSPTGEATPSHIPRCTSPCEHPTSQPPSIPLSGFVHGHDAQGLVQGPAVDCDNQFARG